MQDRLLIMTRIKKTYEYVEKVLENYPYKYIEYKNKIINLFLEMIECIYVGNFGINFKDNRNKTIAKIAVIDYILKLSFKKEIISKKQYENISKNLYDIKNMLLGWSCIYEEI